LDTILVLKVEVQKLLPEAINLFSSGIFDFFFSHWLDLQDEQLFCSTCMAPGESFIAAETEPIFSSSSHFLP
jgi:hypothetical protein